MDLLAPTCSQSLLRGAGLWILLCWGFCTAASWPFSWSALTARTLLKCNCCTPPNKKNGPFERKVSSFPTIHVQGFISLKKTLSPKHRRRSFSFFFGTFLSICCFFLKEYFFFIAGHRGNTSCFKSILSKSVVLKLVNSCVCLRWL